MSTPAHVREAAAVLRGVYVACPNHALLPSKTVMQFIALKARSRLSTFLRDRDYSALTDLGVIKVYATALFTAFSTADDVDRLDTCVRLFMHGLKAPMVCKAYERWRGASIDKVKRDPYGSMFDLQGTLDDADALARHLSPAKRIVEHAKWLLKAARSDGHTALPLGVMVPKLVARTPASAEDTRRVVCGADDFVEIDGYVTDAETAASEAFIATEIRKRVRGTPMDIACTNHMTDEQRAAAKLIGDNGMAIVTGGPGTGKTTLVRMVVEAVGESRCMLMAPTGRAARNLGGATVHSASGGMLRRRPIQETSQADVPADVALIIVDESSMLSTDLMIGVLNLAPPGCKIVFVGDADQLPPVGAGNVFRDMIESGAVPTVQLKYNHRSVTGIQKLAADILTGTVSRGYGDSVRMVSATSPSDAMRAIVTLSSTEASVLVPHNAYRHTLNRALQSVRRPVPVRLFDPEGWGCSKDERGTMRTDTEGVTTLDFSKKMTMAVDQAITITRPIDPMLPGDLVMALKNQNKKRVRPGEVSACNGDIGTLVRSRPKAVVKFGDGLTEFPDVDPWLSLAYVATVHKFQGSECDEVIVPVLQTSSWDRQLLYTAVTRAKTRVTLVGSWQCVDTIAKRTRSTRWTALSKLL